MRMIESKRVIAEGVSETLLHRANMLRQTAADIEAGKTVAVAVVAIEVDEEKEQYCSRYFACERGRFMLIGGLTCLVTELADRLNNED